MPGACFMCPYVGLFIYDNVLTARAEAMRRHNDLWLLVTDFGNGGVFSRG